MIVDRKAVWEKQQFFDKAAAGWMMQYDERERRTLQYAMRAIRSSLPGGGHHVIDLGCGTGILFPFLDGLPYIGMDVSFRMLERCNSALSGTGKGLLQADAHRLPIRDSGISGIIAFSVLPHLGDTAGFFNECRRVLIPGGTLSILHLNPAERINAIHSGIGGAIGRDFLADGDTTEKQLQRCGFTIEIRETAEHYFFIARKH
jgi:ubiquinone/menaquinone biosynthesis C-methylase UbiE